MRLRSASSSIEIKRILPYGLSKMVLRVPDIRRHKTLLNATRRLILGLRLRRLSRPFSLSWDYAPACEMELLYADFISGHI